MRWYRVLIEVCKFLKNSPLFPLYDHIHIPIDKYSLTRDRESTQRHRRMYQEIKNTLAYSNASVVSQREIDPEREWEDKKREREIQRIEVQTTHVISNSVMTK